MHSLLERGKAAINSAAVASGVRAAPEPGLLDHAKKYAEEKGEQIHDFIRSKSPWAAEQLDEAAVAAGELEAKGFSKHGASFNASLLRPLQDGTSAVVASVTKTATCAPAQDAAAAFALWNVLCFWVNVVVLAVHLLLPFGSALSELLSVGTGYAVAYTLHFVFLRSPQVKWMRGSLLVLGLYVAYELASGFGLSPTAFAVAFCDSRPFMGATIVGATSLPQLDESLAGFDVTWTDEMEDGVKAVLGEYPDPWRMLVRGGG